MDGKSQAFCAMHDRKSAESLARRIALRRDGSRHVRHAGSQSPQDSKYTWDYYKVMKVISGEEAFGPITGRCPLAPK